jgi:hypothetical protein
MTFCSARLRWVLAASVTLLTASQPARADFALNENFDDYTNGALVGQRGWVTVGSSPGVVLTDAPLSGPPVGRYGVEPRAGRYRRS